MTNEMMGITKLKDARLQMGILLHTLPVDRIDLGPVF